jgi:hypothetical protein
MSKVHMLWATLIVVIISILYVNFEYSNRTFLDPTQEFMQESGIKRVDIEFVDDKILINVRLLKPLTCENVTNILGISTFSLKGKQYIPTCVYKNKNSMSITYIPSSGI